VIRARRILVLGVMAAALIGLPRAAAAGLDVCNDTDSRVGLALGYSTGDTWMSEGWWHLDAHQCAALIQSDLQGRYYYLFAIDFDAGGGWSGPSTLCVAPGEFTIVGRDDCSARGHHVAGFMEVDTARAPDWTVRLDAASRRPGNPSPSASPSPAPSPSLAPSAGEGN